MRVCATHVFPGPTHVLVRPSRHVAFDRGKLAALVAGGRRPHEPWPQVRWPVAGPAAGSGPTRADTSAVSFRCPSGRRCVAGVPDRSPCHSWVPLTCEPRRGRPTVRRGQVPLPRLHPPRPPDLRVRRSGQVSGARTTRHDEPERPCGPRPSGVPRRPGGTRHRRVLGGCPGPGRGHRHARVAPRPAGCRRWEHRREPARR